MNEVLIVLGWILLGFLGITVLGFIIAYIIFTIKIAISWVFIAFDEDEEVVDLHLLKFKLKKQIEKYEKKILVYADKIKEMNTNEKKS